MTQEKIIEGQKLLDAIAECHDVIEGCDAANIRQVRAVTIATFKDSDLHFFTTDGEMRATISTLALSFLATVKSLAEKRKEQLIKEFNEL